MLTRNTKNIYQALNENEIDKLLKQQRKKVEAYVINNASLDVPRQLKEIETIVHELIVIEQWWMIEQGKFDIDKIEKAEEKIIEIEDLITKIYKHQDKLIKSSNIKYNVLEKIYKQYIQILVPVEYVNVPKDKSIEYLEEMYYGRKKEAENIIQKYVENLETQAKEINKKNIEEYLLNRQFIEKPILDNLINQKQMNKLLEALEEYFKSQKSINIECKYNHLVERPKYEKEQMFKTLQETINNILGNAHSVNIIKHIKNSDIYCYELTENPNLCLTNGLYASVLMVNGFESYMDLTILAHELGHLVETDFAVNDIRLALPDNEGYVEIPSSLYELIINKYIASSKKNKFILVCFIKKVLVDYPLMIDIERKIFKGSSLTKAYNDALRIIENYPYIDSQSVEFKFKLEDTIILSLLDNFKYVIGILVALVLLDKIESKEENILERYNNYLKADDNLTGYERLKYYLDIDITDQTFIEKAYEIAINLIKQEAK